MAITTANVTTSTANVYVSTSNVAVTFLSLTNYSASNVTANLYIVPSGDSPSNLNMVLSNLSITTQDTYQFYVGNEKLILVPGDSIQASAGANNSINAITSYTFV